MRRIRFVLVFAGFASAFLSSVTPLAWAEDPPRLPEAGVASATQPTRIETDQKTGAIRFIVDGREEARIDANGLHVRDDIDYGRMANDIGGPVEYDRRFKAEPER